MPSIFRKCSSLLSSTVGYLLGQVSQGVGEQAKEWIGGRFHDRSRELQEAVGEAYALAWDIIQAGLKGGGGLFDAFGNLDRRSRHDERFPPAQERFTGAMQHPEVILAATGTTSSGKSTVVNLLCGSQIMPVAVGEKSAGVVTIHHAPERRLVIHATDGANWPTGEWPRAGEPDLTDEAIRKLLGQVMDGYNALRDTEREPACPLVELHYPTRLGMHPELLDLPAGCTFRILDLPGLKYVGDDGNGRVIRQSSREALCLVPYDSAEVDPVKKRNLLEQEADQVKELGGSPVRMLFVLNRIDEFGKNIEGEREGEEFVHKTTVAIRQVLLDKVPEHTDYIQRLQPIKLSAKPGLLALLARTRGGDEQIQALQGLDDSFRRLIPEEVRDELLGNVRKWMPLQVQAVAEAVLITSHAAAFEQTLRDHIHERLPELIVPEAVERFHAAASYDAVAWAELLVQAELNSTQERYRRECERIELARNSLAALREDSTRLLCARFDHIRGLVQQSPPQDESQLATVLTDMRVTLLDLEHTPPYDQLPEGSLTPLYAWRDELAGMVDKVLDCISRALTEGRPLQQPNVTTVIDQLPRGTRHALTQSCDALRQAGYTPHLARQGGRRIAETESDRQQLHNLNQSLKTLAEHLRPALEDIVYRSSQNEFDRVFEALRRLFDRHRQYVEEAAQGIACDLGLRLNLEMPLAALTRIQSELGPHYDLNAGFSTERQQQQVQVGTEQVKVGERNETWQESVAEESSPGLLGWIKGKVLGTVRWVTRQRSVPIFEEKPKYELRTCDEASVPSVKELLQGWKEDTQRQEPKMVVDFVRWLLQQAEEVTRTIEAFQTQLLERYRDELDRTHAAVKEVTDEELRRWSAVGEKLQAFRDSFERFARLAPQA